MAIRKHFWSQTHTVTTVVHGGGLIGIIDRHPTLGPICTVVGALLIAFWGWSREDRRRKREQRAFIRLDEETVKGAALGIDTLRFFSLAGDRDAARRAAEDVEGTLVLPPLDEIVQIPLEKWPSVQLYISTRSVRDQVYNLMSATKPVPGMGLADDLTVRSEKVDDAIERFITARSTLPASLSEKGKMIAGKVRTALTQLIGAKRAAPTDKLL